MSGRAGSLFSHLIEPLEVSEFFSSSWECQPQHFRGAQNNASLSHILTWETLDEVLLRLLSPSCPEEAELVIYKNQRISDEYSSPYAAYLGGSSLIINHVDTVCEPVQGLCRALRADFPSVYANCYVTPRFSQGAPAHADDRDVLVFQLEGCKSWTVHGEPPVWLPYTNEQVGKNGLTVPPESLKGRPIVEKVLHKGDVLYVPRGFVHFAKTKAEPSLHVTVAIPTFDWSLSRVIAEAIQDSLDGPSSSSKSFWRKSAPFYNSADWTRVIDKAALHDVIEALDLQRAEHIFRAKNAAHNRRQAEALAEACSTELSCLPLNSSRYATFAKSPSKHELVAKFERLGLGAAAHNLVEVAACLPWNECCQIDELAGLTGTADNRLVDKVA